MPERGQLSVPLAEICNRHAIELSDRRLGGDIEVLINELDRIAQEKPRESIDRRLGGQPEEEDSNFVDGSAGPPLEPHFDSVSPSSVESNGFEAAEGAGSIDGIAEAGVGQSPVTKKRRIWVPVLILCLVIACAALTLGIIVRNSADSAIGRNADEGDARPADVSPNPPQDVQMVRAIRGHSGPVFSVATIVIRKGSEDLPVLLSGGEDNTVRAWNLATGEPMVDPATDIPVRPPVNNYAPVLAVATSFIKNSNGEYRPVAISSGDNNTLLVWEITTGNLVYPPFVRP